MTTAPLGTTPGEQMHDSVDTGLGEGKVVAGRSPRELAIMRFRKDKTGLVVLVIVTIFVILAIIAPILSSIGVLHPTDTHQNLLDEIGLPKGAHGGISAAHPLGITPGTGTDLMSRVILGISTSLLIALTGTLFTVIIGTVLGLVSGASGGKIDAVIGRLVDLTLSFPQTLMLLALSGGVLIMLQNNLHIHPANLAAGVYVVLILAIFGWPTIGRIVRGQVLSLREREFIEAARVIGASRRRIYFKEMLPNLWAPILVYFTLLMPSYVSAEAAFSYLGVGIKAPTPTLGNILTDSINYDVSDFVYFFVPAFLIALIVVSFNLLGDALRDALDPRADR